jgi:hypothetical protein
MVYAYVPKVYNQVNSFSSHVHDILLYDLFVEVGSRK